MNNYGEVFEDGSVRFVRLLPGPTERVWSWIVEGEKRGQWLCGGGDIRKAGETIKFEFHHEDLTPHDEAIPEK
ncbi:MAG: ATPase, partial [Pseudomonadota bacterium]